jgi:ATP-binding cassette subfamily B protein
MADQIVVLDGSRLVEAGTHDDLVAKGGQYAELYQIQAAAYRDRIPRATDRNRLD